VFGLTNLFGSKSKGQTKPQPSVPPAKAAGNKSAGGNRPDKTNVSYVPSSQQKQSYEGGVRFYPPEIKNNAEGSSGKSSAASESLGDKITTSLEKKISADSDRSVAAVENAEKIKTKPEEKESVPPAEQGISSAVQAKMPPAVQEFYKEKAQELTVKKEEKKPEPPVKNDDWKQPSNEKLEVVVEGQSIEALKQPHKTAVEKEENKETFTPPPLAPEQDKVAAPALAAPAKKEPEQSKKDDETAASLFQGFIWSTPKKEEKKVAAQPKPEQKPVQESSPIKQEAKEKKASEQKPAQKTEPAVVQKPQPVPEPKAEPVAKVEDEKKEERSAQVIAAQKVAASQQGTSANPFASNASDSIKIEDERAVSKLFTGEVLTAENGPLKIPDEARSLCALFDDGLWLVSASHRRSPLVTSVVQVAKRLGFKINPPKYVTPNIIIQAYVYAERREYGSVRDDNSARRRIMDTLERAAQLGANDIHIESENGRALVQFRIDGALRRQEVWTQREGDQFLASLYSHSIGQSGTTSNFQEPQAAMLTSDQRGRETIILPKGIISVRCQWVPLSNGGAYLDMRLSYDSTYLWGESFIMADVDSLGFSQKQLKVMQSLRAAPSGLRVFAGPVNQGKTTTLRVVLNRRMAETEMQLNCLMIEDPPEGGVMGARQIGVSASIKDEQRERTFIEIMRCALRLDPDIVMLGEIRDFQTAQFAFRLALTGRQVYTTTHVYSALAIPKRLRDIGIEPYICYDYNLVRGLVCQRLLRSICPNCRIPINKAREEMGPSVKELYRRVRGGLALMIASSKKENAGKDVVKCVTEPDMSEVYMANPEGCPNCYKGRVSRTVCAEIIEADAKLMQLLSENKDDEAKDYWLSPEGMGGVSMLWRGLEKVQAGEVSPDDAEFELGVFIRPKELEQVEEKLGAPK